MIGRLLARQARGRGKGSSAVAFDRLLCQRALKASLNWHEDFIVHLASVARPGVYVELGLYRCGVFNRVAPFAGKAFGADIDPEAGRAMEAQNGAFFLGETTAFAEKLRSEGVEIDLLFIDADHSAKAVKLDFMTFLPLVRDHGLILLHDTFPVDEQMTQPGYSGDGYKTAFALSLERQGWELMTLPFAPGLSLCRKREQQLTWRSGPESDLLPI